MTETLYLEDSYLQTSNAHITEIGDDYLILDRTIFYPQGGGQPSDKGVIATDTAVLKVKHVDYNKGEIKHEGTITGQFSVGQQASLQLDWTQRLKSMQWHTAGHLVDFIARENYPSLIPIQGVHGIGKKLFIEYEGKHDLDIDLLNQKLNAFITKKPDIKTQFVTLEELKELSNWLPAKLPTSKKLRILSIGDSYHIPDGGTQLKTGEEIWHISITKVEYTENSTLVHYQVDIPQASYQVSKHSNKNIKLEIEEVNNKFTSELALIKTTSDLESLRIKYLGKKGLTTRLLQELPKLSGDDKKTYGPILNQLKNNQLKEITQKQLSLTEVSQEQVLDPTVPGIPKAGGRLHPTTVVIRELNSFFRYHGFSVAEGPEIEDVEYNFRRLNLPEGHPATDLQDTLFVEEPNLLMRTHTSSIQTRVLSSHKPPLRVVVPGKVYRNETNSLTNTSFFYQYQGFVVDQGINIQNLKDMLTKAHQFLFGEDVILRYRYKYYPEVSPGMGIDMQCKFCQGVGCPVCKGRGWIETLGSGMTHYNSYKACGIDPELYTGYSFGMGLDRLVMSKFGITDIRKLYGGELVYL